MHPSEKKHKTADRKGGGGATLTVSLTVKYPLFFLTASLTKLLNTVLEKRTARLVDFESPVVSSCF